MYILNNILAIHYTPSDAVDQWEQATIPSDPVDQWEQATTPSAGRRYDRTKTKVVFQNKLI